MRWPSFGLGGSALLHAWRSIHATRERVARQPWRDTILVDALVIPVAIVRLAASNECAGQIDSAGIQL
jgi:hypothetical protein